MTFARPALSDIVQRMRNDVVSRLSSDDPLRRADAEVYSRVMAGGVHGLYGFIDWLADQVIPDTAESECLERWGSVWGVNRKAASSATGAVTFTVQSGAVIPAGTVLQALDGVQYQTSADAAATVPTTTVAVVAMSAGANGNRDAGQVLTLASPIAGVQSTATATLLSGGADVESDAAYRARLLSRIQSPPHGGSSADYKAWTLEVAGVTRAWVYPMELGVGTVTVRFVRDGDGAGSAAIPDASEVAAVQAYLDARRPVTAAVTVVAPVAVALNFSIQGLSPDTAAVRAAVQAELSDLLLREAEPGGTLLLSHIRAAISAATGENDFVLRSPAANVVSPTGSMSVMGTVTWS